MEDLFRIFCCRTEEEAACEDDVDAMSPVHQRGVLLSRVGKSSMSPPRPRGPATSVPQLDLSGTRKDSKGASVSTAAPEDECGGARPPRDVADDSTEATSYKTDTVSQNGTSAYHKPLVAHIKKASVRDGLGVQTDAADRVTLYISSIGEGPVADYNATVSEDQQIQVGDYIVAVSGVRGSTVKMLARIQATQNLDIEVKKPCIWTAKVERAGQESVGLELNFAKDGVSLVVEKVCDGPVKAWNKEHASLALRKHDHIISVNAKEGSMSALLDALQTSGPVTLGMSRPSGK